jgi:hypothetical protein
VLTSLRIWTVLTEPPGGHIQPGRSAAVNQPASSFADSSSNQTAQLSRCCCRVTAVCTSFQSLQVPRPGRCTSVNLPVTSNAASPALPSLSLLLSTALRTSCIAAWAFFPARVAVALSPAQSGSNISTMAMLLPVLPLVCTSCFQSARVRAHEYDK